MEREEIISRIENIAKELDENEPIQRAVQCVLYTTMGTLHHPDRNLLHDLHVTVWKWSEQALAFVLAKKKLM